MAARHLLFIDDNEDSRILIKFAFENRTDWKVLTARDGVEGIAKAETERPDVILLDFINKYSIALKEASETKYWIEIMIKSNIVPSPKFTPLLEENERIIKILTSIINRLKAKEK